VTDTQMLILARALERLIVVGFSGISIVLGWNLFRVKMVKDQAADFTTKDIQIRLARVGPGIFFAMFGMGGLLFSLARPVDVKFSSVPTPTAHESPSATPSSIRFGASTPSDQRRQVAAINTVKVICGTSVNGARTEREKTAQTEALDVLDRLRRQMLISRFGTDFDWYLKIRADVVVQPRKLDELSSAERTKYLDIDAEATASLLED
jgi:hypothetical protein